MSLLGGRGSASVVSGRVLLNASEDLRQARRRTGFVTQGISNNIPVIVTNIVVIICMIACAITARWLRHMPNPKCPGLCTLPK